MNLLNSSLTYQGFVNPDRYRSVLYFIIRCVNWEIFESVVRGYTFLAPNSYNQIGVIYFPDIHKLEFNYHTGHKVYRFSTFQTAHKELFLDLLENSDL